MGYIEVEVLVTFLVTKMVQIVRKHSPHPPPPCFQESGHKRFRETCLFPTREEEFYTKFTSIHLYWYKFARTTTIHTRISFSPPQKGHKNRSLWRTRPCRRCTLTCHCEVPSLCFYGIVYWTHPWMFYLQLPKQDIHALYLRRTIRSRKKRTTFVAIIVLIVNV